MKELDKYVEVNWRQLKTPGIFWSVSSRVVCVMFTSLSKLWTGTLNTTVVHGKEDFLRHLESQTKRGIITVSNHKSCLDDPFMWSFLPWKYAFQNKLLRWSTAAHDVCFKKMWHSQAMLLGKVTPLHRGSGVYQNWMDWCVRRLDAGEWVHIFPEGKINITTENLRLKWGIGRLLSDCTRIPLVIPVHHVGFDDILPNELPYRLHVGKKASIYIGSPLDFTEEIEKLKSLKMSPREIRQHLTDIIQQHMRTQRVDAEQFHQRSHQLDL